MAIAVTVDNAVTTITLTEGVPAFLKRGHECRSGITLLPECRHFGFYFLGIDAAFLRPEVFPIGNLAAPPLARLRSRRGRFVVKLLLQLGAGVVMCQIGEAIGGDGHGVRIDPAPDNM